MFNASLLLAASLMTLFLYPMTAMAADVLPPGGVADGGDLPNVTSTPCTGQPDGYEWTNKKSGRTFVCQNGVSVLKGLNPPKRPCVADVTPNGFSDEHCSKIVTNDDGKMGTGGKGNDKTGSGGDGKGGNGTGKGSGGGTGGGSGSGGGSAGSGSGSGNGGAGAGSGSGGSGSAGSGSGNGVQGSGAASPDRGSGGGSGGGSGATSGNDTGGSSGSGAGSGSGLSNEAYLAALREWGKRWADYFKELAEREQLVQTNLTKELASCVLIYGASKLGKECSDAAIKKAELEKQRIEKLRSDGIARAAKEKAAIDAMKPNSVPSVPMPNGGNGVGGGSGNGDNVTNNNITNNITNNDTTINNNTNITNHGGSGGGSKSGGNGNGGSGQTGNNVGNGAGDEDGKGKGDGLSEYCAKNPDALACQKIGKVSDVNEPSGEFQKLDKDLSDLKKGLEARGKAASDGLAYKFKNFLGRANTAACPPPITFEFLGKQGAIKYDWVCALLEKIRGLVIAVFAFFTSRFVFKGLK